MLACVGIALDSRPFRLERRVRLAATTRRRMQHVFAPGISSLASRCLASSIATSLFCVMLRSPRLPLAARRRPRLSGSQVLGAPPGSSAVRALPLPSGSRGKGTSRARARETQRAGIMKRCARKACRACDWSQVHSAPLLPAPLDAALDPFLKVPLSLPCSPFLASPAGEDGRGVGAVL